MVKYFIKLIFLRRVTRYLGLNSFLHKIIYFNDSYEEKFDKCFSSHIKHGFIVYDIGANIGHFSLIYSDLVGDNGKVVAFEPSTQNFKKLSENVSKSNKNIISVNMGVGAFRSKSWISQGNDNIGATSKIEKFQNGEGNWVEICTLNDLEKDYGLPNAIKIDVEGFEFEVLEGGKVILSNDLVKVVGIEIHSEILNKRGVENCHEKIEKILLKHGFKIHYPDFSHIIGYR